MNSNFNRRRWLQLAASAGAAPVLRGETREIGNQHFALSVDKHTGALTGLLVKRNGAELVSEKRLAANFRLCVPLPDYLCNYVDGAQQQAKRVEAAADRVDVEFSGLRAEKGDVPIDLSYSIRLVGDTVRFRARLTNRGAHPVSEFWFPRIGGWTGFGGPNAKLATPNYTSCRHELALFDRFPGERGLGSEAAEYSVDYPRMVMPWWDLYDEASKTGLYLGYHDKTFRYSTWHTYLFPDVSGLPESNWMTAPEAAGAPVGMVFSHVRYPFIGPGETYETGEFILRVHEGDWHQGSLFYREWFLRNFPFDKSRSWLRKQSAWFSSIVYQPEDRIVADFATYDKWCQDAEQYGIRCHELIGWHRGGLERNYPEYVPEEKLGGRPAFRKTLKSIRSRGARCLAFVNYNIVDSTSEHYKKLKPFTHQDQFGQTPNGMAWGESTLIARKGFSVRRHVLTSVVPPVEKLLEDYFVDIARDGADGLQIDKVVACSKLDFNPMNTRKPDEALCEGLVQAIGRSLAKCRAVNPEFQLASEAHQDRLIPYADVYYRAADIRGISPLRYVFPEWTSTLHVTMPRDFLRVNVAVLTGAVICVEPELYQASLAAPQYRELAEYIREVERIRHEFAGIIFLGDYFDDQLAVVTEGPRAMAAANLQFAVHGDRATKQKAIVVVNRTKELRRYAWRWLAAGSSKLTLHEPFREPRVVAAGEQIDLRPIGLHILIEG